MAKAIKKAAAKKAATKKAAVKKVAAKKVAAKKSAASPTAKKAASSSPRNSSLKSGNLSSKSASSSSRSSSARSGNSGNVSSSRSTSSRTAPKKVVTGSVKASAPSLRSSTPSRKPAQTDESMMQQLFLNSLKDIYWAEKALVKALGKLSKAATSDELKSAFDEHRQVTEQQVLRLEQVFEMLGQRAQGKKCEAMEGLTKEADSIISETKKGSKTRDVGLIMAAQKAEHYEIASYGSLATLAKLMGLKEAKELLGQTLQEEKEADEKLTQLAESSVNPEAEAEEGSAMPADDGGEIEENNADKPADKGKRENDNEA